MEIPSDCADLILPLRTPRTLLRELRPGDLEDVFVLCSHPDICRYIRPPMSPDEVRDHIQARRRPWHFTEMTWYSLGVCRSGEERVIGELVFRLESRACRRAEVGYRFHPDSQGQGLAAEALAPLIRLLFRHLNLHKLMAYCITENLPSIRLLERFGFEKEGHLRQQQFQDGRWWDLGVYGLLAETFSPLA